MYSRSVKIVLSLIATLAFMLPALSAAQESPPPLTEMWVLVPKADQYDEFLEGMSKHMAFRAEQGDPRRWEAYTPMLGDDLNRVAVRYCCFRWADQDEYAAWGKNTKQVGEHFGEHVAPHVEKYEHYFETIDWPNSHWKAEHGPYKYFAVTNFHLKAGKAAQFDAARDEMSQIAINQGWANDDHVWIWTSTIGGKPQESIVIPHKNFADMDRDEKGFIAFLSEHMGSPDAARDLMTRFSEATWGSDFQIWVLEDGLSMGGED